MTSMRHSPLQPRGPRGGRPARLLVQMTSEAERIRATVLWDHRHRHYPGERFVAVDSSLLVQFRLLHRRFSGRSWRLAVGPSGG